MPGPNLTVISNQHANEVNSTTPWLALLVLDIAANATRPEVHLYVAANDEDVIFRGVTYKAFQFDFPEIENKPGELPQFQVRLSNVNKTAHRLLEDYTGGVGGIATFMIVSGKDLQAAEPAHLYQFEIKSAVAKDDYATMTLGGENPMRRQFPTIFLMEDHCAWTYNSPVRRAALDPVGTVCGYLGASSTCDYTLNGTYGCVAHGNQLRFGGVPGISSQGFRTASIS